MADKREVVIVGAARTPIGGYGGSLKDFSACDLGAHVVKAAFARAGVDAKEAQHLVLGNVIHTEARDMVGDLRLAQSAAFDTLDAQRDDAPLHLQLSDALLDFSHRFDLDIAQRTLGGIDERQSGATLDMAVAPDLRMSVEFGSITRERGDNVQFSSTPGESSYLLARLAWQHDDGVTRILIGQRDGFETIHPVAIEREQRIDSRLSATVGVGLHMASRA